MGFVSFREGNTWNHFPCKASVYHTIEATIDSKWVFQVARIFVIANTSGTSQHILQQNKATLPKINMEHNNGGLEGDFPFHIGDF